MNNTIEKRIDKTDIEVGALAYTDRWRWERVLTIGRKVEKLREKEKELNKQASVLIKEIMAEPDYKENYKKVRKYYRQKELKPNE